MAAAAAVSGPFEWTSTSTPAAAAAGGIEYLR